MKKNAAKKKTDPVATLVGFAEDMGIDSMESHIESELETRFDRHYKEGKLVDRQRAIADARQFQDLTEASVAQHPAFKHMVQQLAKDIAKSAQRWSLEFQVSMTYDE
jgi:hypothetical protein